MSLMGHAVVNTCWDIEGFFVCMTSILLLFNNVNTLLENLGTVSTCGKKPVLTVNGLKPPCRCQIAAGKDCDLLELVLVGQTVADICEQQLQRRGHEGDIFPLLSFSTASEVNLNELEWV